MAPPKDKDTATEAGTAAAPGAAAGVDTTATDTQDSPTPAPDTTDVSASGTGGEDGKKQAEDAEKTEPPPPEETPDYEQLWNNGWVFGGGAAALATLIVGASGLPGMLLALAVGIPAGIMLPKVIDKHRGVDKETKFKALDAKSAEGGEKHATIADIDIDKDGYISIAELQEAGGRGALELQHAIEEVLGQQEHSSYLKNIRLVDANKHEIDANTTFAIPFEKETTQKHGH